MTDNSEGQFFLASIKAPSAVASSAEETMLCGISLANALFGYEKPKFHITESLHAASLLSFVVRQNTKCKEVLIEIPYEKKTGKPTISFYECIVRAAAHAIKSKSEEENVIGLLRLLCEWVNASALSARVFLDNKNYFLAVCKHAMNVIYTRSLLICYVTLRQ